jgi:hypothetical protein
MDGECPMPGKGAMPAEKNEPILHSGTEKPVGDGRDDDGKPDGQKVRGAHKSRPESR